MKIEEPAPSLIIERSFLERLSLPIRSGVCAELWHSGFEEYARYFFESDRINPFVLEGTQCIFESLLQTQDPYLEWACARPEYESWCRYHAFHAASQALRSKNLAVFLQLIDHLPPIPVEDKPEPGSTGYFYPKVSRQAVETAQNEWLVLFSNSLKEGPDYWNPLFERAQKKGNPPLLMKCLDEIWKHAQSLDSVELTVSYLERLKTVAPHRFINEKTGPEPISGLLLQLLNLSYSIKPQIIHALLDQYDGQLLDEENRLIGNQLQSSLEPLLRAFDHLIELPGSSSSSPIIEQRLEILLRLCQAGFDPNKETGCAPLEIPRKDSLIQSLIKSHHDQLASYILDRSPILSTDSYAARTSSGYSRSGKIGTIALAFIHDCPLTLQKLAERGARLNEIIKLSQSAEARRKTPELCALTEALQLSRIKRRTKKPIMTASSRIRI